MAITPGERRRYRHEVSDSEEEDDTTSPIKRIKIENARRARHLPADDENVESASTVSDGDEDDDEDEEAANNRRDAMFGDDARNIEAYERSRARRREFGKASEAGVITNLTIIDFMNHKEFTVNFGTRLNFLVGHNGSGKSACLTAISVALGSKAAGTGRGTGLKDLIRKGCNQATIRLTLNNSGIQAFRNDVYGPNIIIERVIHSNGSSSYKFRGSLDGKIVATKREELTHIVEHFDITIDSPLAVLTQDAARSFLQNASESSLYSFFVHGTGLKHLSLQYERLAHNVAIMENLIKTNRESLAGKEHKLADMEKRMARTNALEALQSKQDRLTGEVAWAYVINKEKERDGVRETTESQKKKLEAVKVELAKAEDIYAPLKAEAEATQAELERFETSQKPLEDGMRKAKKQLNIAQNKLQSELNGITAIEHTIAAKKREVAQLTKKIDDVNTARTADENPEQARIRVDIAKLETLLARIKADRPIKYEAARLRQEEVTRAEAAEEDARAQVGDIRSQLDNAKSRLVDLRTQAGNRLAAFGTNLEEVFKEFDRARWVKARPLGPLGRYVQLLDDEYKEVITATLGELMSAFAVQDSRDKATCMDILQRCHRTKGYAAGTGRGIGSIIQHSGQPVSFEKGDLSMFGKTILSQLRIDNTEALGLLVVQRGIERTMLARDPTAANMLLLSLHQKNIHKVSVYAQNGFMASGRKEAKGTTGIRRWEGNQMFTKDVAADIRDAEAEVERLNSQWQTRREELSKATEARKDATVALTRARAAAASTEKGEPDCIAKIGRLKQDLEERNDDNKIDALTETKTAAEESVIVAEGQMEGLRIALNDLRTDIQKCKEEVAQYARRQDEWIPERDLKRQSLANLLEQVAQAQKALAHWRSSSIRHTDAVEELQRKLANVEAEVEDWTAEAVKVCPTRVEVDRPSAEISAELKATKRRIDESRRSGQISALDLAPQYESLKAELKTSFEQTNQLAIFNEMLQRAVTTRRAWWGEIRVHIAARAKTLFIIQLQKRNFEGRLEFDHEGERLSIKIGTSLTGTQAGAATKAFKDPKSLSGGERSFSTVALLLSLWEVANCPIRCLDEWDVFLDHVNRGIAAAMLIEGARYSDGKQFILITPQDLSGVNFAGQDVRVLRLPDPPRGQTTLDFAPVRAA